MAGGFTEATIRLGESLIDELPHHTVCKYTKDGVDGLMVSRPEIFGKATAGCVDLAFIYIDNHGTPHTQFLPGHNVEQRNDLSSALARIRSKAS